jgi:hypothetical protein
MKTTSKNHLPAGYLFLIIFSSLFFQFCKSSQATLIEKTESIEEKSQLVSFESDLLPIMKRSCTPCHFPERGKVKMLNTYEATAESINYILYRVELPTDDEEYMPFKSKRQALSAEEIQLFKDWKSQGMGE